MSNLNFVELDMAEVARILNHRYRNRTVGLEKGQKGLAFNNIVRELFEECGFILGYYDLRIFKSDVVLTKNELKKSKRPFEKKYHLPKAYHLPEEGDGQIFTALQIEELELNEDSY